MKTERITFALGVLLSIAFAVSCWRYFEHFSIPSSLRPAHFVFDTIELVHLRWTDIKYKFTQKEVTKPQAALIAIDDDSLNEIGRWPWDRELVAQMTEEALAHKASSVGFDVIFSEPDKANPQSDLRFGKTVTDLNDRIILGTFSETTFPYKSYQDYCVAKAFQFSGGEQLVKINPTLIFDLPTNALDEADWEALFSPLFAELQNIEESIVLKKNKVATLEELPTYQKNYLQARKKAILFEYCKEWLTPQDRFISKETEKALGEHYLNVFASVLKVNSFEQVQKEIKARAINVAVPQYGAWTPNISTLQDPSTFTASFIAKLDRDGYVRRYPLFYRTGNQLGLSFIPSLALQSYLLSKGYRAEVKAYSKDNSLLVKTVSVYSNETDRHVMDIPVDREGQMLIRYYGRTMALPHIPAKEFLYKKETIAVQQSKLDSKSQSLVIEEKTIPRTEYLKDKSLIVGATAIGLYDLRNTPLEANYPGPEIHLTALQNLLEGEFIRAWAAEEKWAPWIAIVVGLALSALWSFSGFIFTFVAFALIAIAAIFLDFYFFIEKNIVVHSILFLVHILALFFVIQIYKYFSEEKKKLEIKKTFAKYVSPALVDDILKDTENLKLGGRREYMSVFFSDVRGFTTISEKLAPEELSRILNLYLSPMTEIVFKHNGTLDKYMGDAIMAFFGAPVKNTTHAKDACRCALESIEKLKHIQDEFAKQGLPRIDIGIGINTGEMSVGNMGSNIVQSYTVMGDSVNLASRLEGINKEYGTRIIISEFTKKEVEDSFATREVDLVKVKGKDLPVTIYELICEGECRTEMAQALGHYNQGLKLYKNKKFDEAITFFEKAIQTLGQDPVSELYIERCQELRSMPLDDNWDGVFVMKTK
ncbi:MAG: CHASE2 domain-containing protein [Bdellovibrionia bacterium]